MSALTAERLRELLHYDPETGLLTRLVALSHNANMAPTRGYLHANAEICNRKHGLRVDGRQYLAHRLAWLYMTGAWPRGQIDHINGDATDNRWANLREVSPGENMRNVSRPKSNTSGAVGVAWRESRQKWRATINVNGTAKQIGSYSTIIDAVAARKRAERELGFHENHGRPSPWPSLQ